MLRINLATGLAMTLVLVLSGAVLLQVAAPHLVRCPPFLRRWTRFVAGAAARQRDRERPATHSHVHSHVRR